MKKELEYSEIGTEKVPLPEPLKNAGLYTGDVLFDKKPWGNNYLQPRIEPDAVSFSSQFYAPHHIPSYNRPGNNTVNTPLFTEYKDTQNIDQFNFSCHN